jgi:copper(I)-binding protein
MKKLLFLLPLLLCTKFAYADDSSIQVSNAWARPTMGDGKETAIYLDIKNTGHELVTLTKVSSPIGDAMMHESMEHDGMMHMQPLATQQIKPGASLSFSPGHNHIMVDGLKQALKVGDSVKLTLHFANDKSTTINVPVANAGGKQP